MTENLFSSLVIGLAIVAGGYILANNQVTTINTPVASGTLQVSSEGRVSVAPDMVVFSLSSVAKAPTSKGAYDSVNQTIASVKSILREAGVADTDIQTTALYLNPEYSYTDGVTRPDGFSATHTLSVKVRDLTNANTILDSVTSVANIQIQNIAYDLDKKDPIYEQARTMALEKAREKAEKMASVAGVKIKKVQSLSENTSMETYPRPYQNAMFDMKVASPEASTSLSSGQLEYTTVVNVTYELE